MSGILGIYDNETDYANNLMDYIKRKQKRFTQVRVFTNDNSLQEFLTYNQMEILLLGENIPRDGVLHENIKNICLLTEQKYIPMASNNLPTEGKVSTFNYPVIYKFQSAEGVMKELFNYFPMVATGSISYEAESNFIKIVSVFSIARDTEQLVLSLSLAQQYARKKKTLYINLNIFQALPELPEQNMDKSLSEFIYYLKQNHPNLMTKMNGIVRKKEMLDFIQGVTFGPDLYELTMEDMNLWIKELKNSGQYEVIIFDVGSFFQATLELFRESNQLFLLLGENALEQVKFKNFKNQLLWAGFDDVIHKLDVIALNRELEEKFLQATAEGLYNNQYVEFAAPYVEE